MSEAGPQGSTFGKTLLRRALPRAWVQALRCWQAPRLVAHFRKRDWTPFAWLQTYLQAGDTVVDAGANMGYISARLADIVGPQGRVYAFEPVPETFALLARSVRILQLAQVTPVPMGLSMETGAHHMVVPAYKDGGENLYEAQLMSSATPPQPGRTVTVETGRLDDYWQAHGQPRVRFVKIDVEGHEYAVLQGAVRLVERDHPALYIEINGDPDLPGSPAAKVFAWLAEQGYMPYIFFNQIPQPRQAGQVDVDYLFLYHESG